MKKFNYLHSTGTAFIVVAAGYSSYVYAADRFNVYALEIDNPGNLPADLSQFSREGEQPPGNYRTSIWLNGNETETRDLTFQKKGNADLQPVIYLRDLERWAVNTGAIPALQGVKPDDAVMPLTAFIPDATVDFDFSRQQLNLTIPQALMKNSAQGSVSPDLWDDGIPALITSYAFTGANNWRDDTEQNTRADSYFLSLRNGLNLGGWRLRNYSTWNYNSATDDNSPRQQWNSINTWLQHDIKALKSQFVLGDSYTPSDIFDSIQFRGMQVASDDNMLPDSLRGFAPTVRGIARSNAQVTVRQNDAIIYQTYVPAGAFTINDLYPTSSSGDLQVTVKEADGSERSFIQPFSSVPMMQREGRLKYAVTAGKYRSSVSGGEEPRFVQSTLMYGLNNRLTIYGGTQLAEHYRSAAMGLGVGLGELGSVSLDATQAWSTPDDRDQQGQSYRFQYAKDIQATDSTVTLAGYRYSTSGFYTLNETADYQAIQESSEDAATWTRNNKRSKLQIILTQNIAGGQGGALSFSGYQQDYWGLDGYERNATVSYNQNWQSVSWTLSWSYISNAGRESDTDQQIALNISVPFARWLTNSYATGGFTTSKNGDTNYQAGLSGTALEDRNLSWSIAGGGQNHGGDNSGNLSADYKAGYGEVNGGYMWSASNQQVNYGVQGSLLLHPWGMTLGQPLGGDMAAIALVKAPDAANVTVENNTGVKTDWRGYTIVPWLSPYKRSRIALEPATLNDDVDITENVQQVVPTAGAVVLADYQTHVGARLLLRLTHHGKPLPFGTLVTVNADKTNTGIVADGGDVYLSGINPGDVVLAQWGKGVRQHCQSTIPGLSTSPARGIQQATAVCQQ